MGGFNNQGNLGGGLGGGNDIGGMGGSVARQG